jgi:uncharacterized protein (TIGR00369 family)
MRVSLRRVWRNHGSRSTVSPPLLSLPGNPTVKPPDRPPNLSRVIDIFESIPHCRQLGMTVVELRFGYGLMRLPYDPKLIGNPLTGVVHGGVITSFLDTLCGLVVMSWVSEGTPIATLDLRIDYLRPALPKHDIVGSAECYKVTDSVAFVRGIAYQETFRNPVANCTGTFMLSSTGFTGHGDRPAG